MRVFREPAVFAKLAPLTHGTAVTVYTILFAHRVISSSSHHLAVLPSDPSPIGRATHHFLRQESQHEDVRREQIVGMAICTESSVAPATEVLLVTRGRVESAKLLFVRVASRRFKPQQVEQAGTDTDRPGTQRSRDDRCDLGCCRRRPRMTCCEFQSGRDWHWFHPR